MEVFWHIGSYLKTGSRSDLFNRSTAEPILGERALLQRSWLVLKGRKQFIKVVEKEGLGLIWFSLIDVNIGQND